MAKPVDWNKVSLLTPGMTNLGNQFNKRWPTRDGSSDGAVGDYAHTQELSDHNPDDTSKHNASWDSDSDNVPEVRAIDVDNDLNESGMNMQSVIDHMRTLPNLGSVIRYMIYNKKMYHVDDGFKPTNYTGASPHTEHAHFSGARSQSADSNTTFNFHFEKVGDPMPTVDEIWGKVLDNPYTAGPDTTTAGGYLRYAPSLSGIVNALKPFFEALGVDIDAIQVELDRVPTAEENAAATAQAISGMPIENIASVLNSTLTEAQRIQLKELI